MSDIVCTGATGMVHTKLCGIPLPLPAKICSWKF